MPANKVETFGPVALSNAYTTNILAPAVAGASAVGYTATATVIFLKHLRIANKTGAAATCRLYKGATGANTSGTEVVFDLTVAANSYVDLYFQNLRLEGAGGFLVGGASALTTLVLTGEGEVGLV